MNVFLLDFFRENLTSPLFTCAQHEKMILAAWSVCFPSQACDVALFLRRSGNSMVTSLREAAMALAVRDEWIILAASDKL